MEHEILNRCINTTETLTYEIIGSLNLMKLIGQTNFDNLQTSANINRANPINIKR